MKVLFLITISIALALSSGDSLAAKFDIWETGMDINQIVSVAREHNIPIARSGIVHGYSKFEQKLVDDQFFKAPVLEYNARFGEYGSKVFLKLSEQPKQLYEIEIRINGIKFRDDFVKEMVGTLKQKYGPYRERKDWVFHYYEWRPEESSQVILRMGSGAASIFYIDPRMKEIVEARRKEKEIGAIRRDGKIF